MWFDVELPARWPAQPPRAYALERIIHQPVGARTLKLHLVKSGNMTLTSLNKHRDESLLDGFPARLYNHIGGRP